MYQLGEFFRFFAFFIPFIAVFLFNIPLYGLFACLPFWFFYVMFDNVKRGALIFPKCEWEKGPFDAAGLPHLVRKFFENGKDFLESQGFSPKEEGLSTFQTVLFGKREVKSYGHLFENPQTGERASLNLVIAWEPATSSCLFMNTVVRFQTQTTGPRLMTSNAKTLNPKIAGPDIEAQYLDEPDMGRLLAAHREWVVGHGQKILKDWPLSSSEYAQLNFETEIKKMAEQGRVFWDANLGGYRFRIGAAIQTLFRFFAGRSRRTGELRGLRSFTWKIRPAGVTDVLRTVPGTGDKEDGLDGGKAVAFNVTLWGVFRKRLCVLATGPWLLFFSLLLILMSCGVYLQFWMKFEPLGILYYLASFILGLFLLVLVGAILTLFLPLGDGKERRKFGRRVLKFNDQVICYEAPHGVTTCVLGSYPEAVKVGRSFWLKIPGSNSFVVGPKNFEGNGYQVFQEEMAAKRLIRPFWTARVAPWLVLASLVIMTFGFLDTEYTKSGFYRTMKGVCGKDHAVLVVYKTLTYRKAPHLVRYFVPVFDILEAFDEGLLGEVKTQLQGEVLEITPKEITRSAGQWGGGYLLDLVPMGQKIFLVSESFGRQEDPLMRFHAYAIANGKFDPASKEELAALVPNKEEFVPVLPEGWRFIQPGRGGREAWTPRSEKLVGDYAYFERSIRDEKKNGWISFFGVTQGGKETVVYQNDPSEYKDETISRDEYEKVVE